MGEFREPDVRYDKAAWILQINRWLKAIVTLMNADAGVVILSDGETARVLSRHNVPHAFMSTPVTVKAAPYAVDETVLLRDATSRPDLHAFLGALALKATGFYFRRPLSVSGDRVISLVVFGETPQPNLADREMVFAEEIADQMAKELERYYPSGVAHLSASMRMTRDEIEAWMEKTDLPTALLDSALNVKGANERMRTLLPVNWDKLIGRPLSEVKIPAAGAIEFLFRHAIETHVSTPRMDVSLEEATAPGLPATVRVVGSPIVPIDGEVVLIATIDPSRIDDKPRRSVTGFGRGVKEPTAEFLLETLVQRRALRSRNDVSYVTLRSWRNSIRTHQIAALKAIKRTAPESIAGAIAGEMADDIRSLFGIGGFRAVVPIPCGHSGGETCLSVAIAKALAADIGLPVAHALALHPAKGASHPKTNAKREAMQLVTPVQGPVLLVDDVATSGRHIEEATLLLRSTGTSVLAIAWISGDAEKDDQKG